MDRRGADDRLVGKRQLGRVEEERPRLRAADSPVERDQLLERAALVEGGVVEAAYHDVGDVLEPVRAEQVPWSGRREGRKRILAFDAALRQVVRPAPAQRDSAVTLGADEQPADVRVLAQCREQIRMPLFDLLERKPASLLHQVDQPQVA